MVTQSAGPYTAVPMGMALAAHECRGRTAAEQMEYLRKAAHTISHARPTTVKRMALLCDLCLAEAERALAAGEDTAQAIVNKTVELNNTRYERVAKIGKYLVDLFPENGTVMTHCFAETIVGMMLRECSERGKHIRLSSAPETRPYFSGRAPDRDGLPRHGLRCHRHLRQYAGLCHAARGRGCAHHRR